MPSSVTVYLVTPQGGDAGELLAVEEDEAAGHPIREVDRLVVTKEAAHERPSGRRRWPRATPPALRAGHDDERRGHLAHRGPVEEVAHLRGHWAGRR